MATRVVPARARFAAAVVGARPGTRVLEVGCGPGAVASLVCPRLDPVAGGGMLAVDRSAVAVARTAERCAAFVDAGVLTVVRSDLAGLRIEDGTVDVALTVNVNLFWTRDPGPELEVLRALLAPGGVLHVLYEGAPPAAVAAGLRRHGWDTVPVSGDGGAGVTGRPA
ncbi:MULTISPECIES: bifunctional 2-polyprenyl-6-hydroxyphenol methylase/3-demethylubiquinol 3-O-methyltransferase UbiG [unclassified Pseudonocardia]|uniref:class I SAM-dependent methyltransferase n=1 Tax=unclassified Pseudonocardia TaxID=2619320 RepID=UPI001CF6574B|nr:MULTISPECIES: class I SAM-dependent methyltransferase [unclassified Pseudonocardia]